MSQQGSIYYTIDPNCSLDYDITIVAQICSGDLGNMIDNELSTQAAEITRLHTILTSSLQHLNISTASGLEQALTSLQIRTYGHDSLAGNHVATLARNLRLALTKTIDTHVVLAEIPHDLEMTTGDIPVVNLVFPPDTLLPSPDQDAVAKWRFSKKDEQQVRTYYHQPTLSRLRYTLRCDLRWSDNQQRCIYQEHKAGHLQFPGMILSDVEISMEGIESWLNGAYRSDVQLQTNEITEMDESQELVWRTSRVTRPTNQHWDDITVPFRGSGLNHCAKRPINRRLLHTAGRWLNTQPILSLSLSNCLVTS
ncbi:hypothetical protein TREMEDRAFT_58323 [Tremella mesenterica DSM 1558]|uniref:uncharacterized protein n=1 Tax=Tremella mesenterica (strain ATCC 24925 / CBS 8224 / DSM 1558 / NBRC 9311 / NRRL Y-6157 / RJB 2259-6 / UBC 559-6) TaxID=578456 RepID=UPI0003F4A485|nr:uncharacterized protein TREMEDRAFT_58323 [Tremella mesenterica DSM 1558]EIW72167.1 hypothetical protein TREMEDRAFT_58323 [Tremella mesenterica DSM 1558]